VLNKFENGIIYRATFALLLVLREEGPDKGNVFYGWQPIRLNSQEKVESDPESDLTARLAL